MEFSKGSDLFDVGKDSSGVCLLYKIKKVNWDNMRKVSVCVFHIGCLNARFCVTCHTFDQCELNISSTMLMF